MKLVTGAGGVVDLAHFGYWLFDRIFCTAFLYSLVYWVEKFRSVLDWRMLMLFGDREAIQMAQGDSITYFLPFEFLFCV